MCSVSAGRLQVGDNTFLEFFFFFQFPFTLLWLQSMADAPPHLLFRQKSRKITTTQSWYLTLTISLLGSHSHNHPSPSWDLTHTISQKTQTLCMWFSAQSQKASSVFPEHFLHLHLFLNCRGHWGSTDDFTTSSLHFSLFSTALWDFANSRPVLFFILSSCLFFCLPCLLPPLTVPCKMVLARPDEQETSPYHCS